MNILHIHFPDKCRTAHRGEWLYSFGSIAFSREVDSVRCRSLTGQHVQCFIAESGCPGSPTREVALGGVREQVLARARGAALSTRNLAAPGCGWQRCTLAPRTEERVFVWVSFRSGNEIPQWGVFLCIYVQKEIHKVLHLPMQKCEGRGDFLSLFSFLLRKEL